MAGEISERYQLNLDILKEMMTVVSYTPLCLVFSVYHREGVFANQHFTVFSVPFSFPS